MSLFKSNRIVALILIVIGCMGIARPDSPPNRSAGEAATERIFYAVEMNGTLCGYSETRLAAIEKDGRALQLMETDIHVRLSVLGAGVDMLIRSVYHVDPVTAQAAFCDMTVEQGPTRAGATAEIHGATVHWSPKAGGGARDIELPADVILENPCYHPHLYRDFVQNSNDRMDYRVFDVMRGEIQKTTYTRKGRETVQLAGETIDTLVLEEVNYGTGVKATQWLDVRQDRIVKTEFLNRVIYLADASVQTRLKRADMDATLFAKANVAINDVFSISYMKVKATISTAGEWVTPDSLNVPGQRFEGTVTDNFIEGVFEISHPRYDGRNAPPFPTEFGSDSGLTRYLQPEKLIESDDPALTRKAGEIAAGSRDAWEAVRHLSRWVADEIGYDIPGGGTALKTFQTRQGECGGHSRLLAALCRGVGIPARVVVGCIYSYLKGGSFGQHAWTEVYMGQAGWIPVDSTAREVDYVDCGHIRLGQEAAFMPKAVEILDYRIASAAPATDAVTEKYAPYLDTYSAGDAPVERGRFRILFQGGGLALDIPARMVCELKDPDADGIWCLKLTDRVGVGFKRDQTGQVCGLTLYESVMMPRADNQAPVAGDVPEGLQPYLGEYRIPMNKGTVRISADGGRLALDLPRRSRIPLRDPDGRGRWYDNRDTGNYISFNRDEAGQVVSLTLFFGEFIPRGVAAAHLVEEVLKNSGLEPALQKYREIRQNPPEGCRFTESSFNMLGYRLLGQGKITEAVEIFKLNTVAYPDSWNAHDSLAEGYLKCGDKPRAIENYEKSLQLNPENEGARKAVDSLKAER
jgi:transglutaminase-like putative cysteine protease